MANLQNLKQELLDELIKITDESGTDPLDRFDIIMSRYINTGDQELLNRAMEAAKVIEDPKERGNAMMQLLDEVEMAQEEEVVESLTQDLSQDTHTPGQPLDTGLVKGSAVKDSLESDK